MIPYAHGGLPAQTTEIKDFKLAIMIDVTVEPRCLPDIFREPHAPYMAWLCSHTYIYAMQPAVLPQLPLGGISRLSMVGLNAALTRITQAKYLFLRGGVRLNRKTPL